MRHKPVLVVMVIYAKELPWCIPISLVLRYMQKSVAKLYSYVFRYKIQFHKVKKLFKISDLNFGITHQFLSY